MIHVVGIFEIDSLLMIEDMVEHRTVGEDIDGICEALYARMLGLDEE